MKLTIHVLQESPVWAWTSKAKFKESMKWLSKSPLYKANSNKNNSKLETNKVKLTLHSKLWTNWKILKKKNRLLMKNPGLNITISFRFYRMQRRRCRNCLLASLSSKSNPQCLVKWKIVWTRSLNSTGKSFTQWLWLCQRLQKFKLIKMRWTV